MAIQGYFFDAVQSGGVYDRLYTSEDFCNYLNLLVGNGVFPSPSTNLQVRAGSGMQVQVLAGSGWINGHKIVNTATMNLSVSAANATLNRIDRVVFYVDYNNRQMGIAIKTGTASSSPSAPSLQRDSSKYELGLATIQVNKQITAITNSMITDTRPNSSVCGWVSALVDQLDSTTLFQQFADAFETWFSDAQSQLSEGNNFAKREGSYTTVSAGESVFDVTAYVPSYDYVYDVLDVYINGLHLTEDEYTINGSTVTLDIPISEAGNVINFVAYKGGNALSNWARQALLTCFANVAWTDPNGQEYYDDLEYALCNYRKNYSMANGTLTKVNGTISNAQSDPYGLHIGTGTTTLQNRRVFVTDRGVAPLKTSSDDVNYQTTTYYPIGIPPTATSCTYAITPSTQYIGAAFYTYDAIADKYTLVTNVGWKQGSYTHTFAAGSVQYMSISTKYDSAGTSYPTEPSALTVNFS